MITADERAQIGDDALIGGGNVLHRLKFYRRPMDEQVLWTDRTWRSPNGTQPEVFTLGELDEAVRTYAGFYHDKGVRKGDVVAVVTASTTEFAINFLALSSLGAIPSLVNAELRPETLREYVRRQGATGVLTDLRRREVFAGLDFVVTSQDIRPDHRELLPMVYPYRHDPSDPVIITHSSGTTGMPKAVPHTHHTLFYGPLYRLRSGDDGSRGRRLIALPGNHAAAMSTMMSALLLRLPVMLLSSQRGVDVLDAIEQFRPNTVFGFATTFAQMAAEKLSTRDLSSVESYYNTGDAAHEAHIRVLIEHGSHERIGRDLKPYRAKGSLFTDGLGTSETGYSIFHNTHRPGSAAFGRCIGKPGGFARVAVLSEDGRPLPAGQVGRLAVSTPTLTPGYWNDSLTWNRMRRAGYWLTGDLAYQDTGGNFYHLDRVSDAIRTEHGVVFSTYTEELLLSKCPELADCTVVAVAEDGVRADWDGDGVAEAYVLLQFAEGHDPGQDPTVRVNEVLSANGFPPLTGALPLDGTAVPVGITGKVLKRVLRDQARELVHRTKAHLAVG